MNFFILFVEEKYSEHFIVTIEKKETGEGRALELRALKVYKFDLLNRLIFS